MSWSRAAAAGVPGVGAFGYGIRGVLPLRMESAVVSGEVWGSEWGSEESVAAAIRKDSVVVVGGWEPDPGGGEWWCAVPEESVSVSGSDCCRGGAVYRKSQLWQGSLGGERETPVCCRGVSRGLPLRRGSDGGDPRGGVCLGLPLRKVDRGEPLRKEDRGEPLRKVDPPLWLLTACEVRMRSSNLSNSAAAA